MRWLNGIRIGCYCRSRRSSSECPVVALIGGDGRQQVLRLPGEELTNLNHTPAFLVDPEPVDFELFRCGPSAVETVRTKRTRALLLLKILKFTRPVGVSGNTRVPVFR